MRLKRSRQKCPSGIPAAAPTTIATFFNPDDSVDPLYMERLAAAIEDAVSSAWEHRFEARIGVGHGHDNVVCAHSDGADWRRWGSIDSGERGEGPLRRPAKGPGIVAGEAAS